jgi:hypothetical protein
MTTPRSAMRYQMKQLPLYSQEFLHYPLQNPLMITVEQQSLNILRRLKGACLYCPRSAYQYDLTICFNREVWVLYSQPFARLITLHLAQAVQQSGALEITILRLGG